MYPSQAMAMPNGMSHTAVVDTRRSSFGINQVVTTQCNRIKFFLAQGLAGIQYVNNPGTIMLGAADRSWDLEPHGGAQYISSSVKAGGAREAGSMH
jgi:hypothetical protein